MDSQNTIDEQASEIAALKQQISAKELSWDLERQKMMKALKSERELRKKARADKKTSEEEKDDIIRSLQSLLEKQKESAEVNQVSTKLTALEDQLKSKDAELKTQEVSFEKKLMQTAVDMENYATQKHSEFIRSEAEWKNTLTALEDQLKESFKRETELRQSRAMEEEWCKQKEEDIKLLTQQNNDLQVQNLNLQELAQQTDKQKAQLKKEEKAAKKEAEKTLKKDRKEEEEREKKEKKENKKREKEELKRLKKEKELMEKRRK